MPANNIVNVRLLVKPKKKKFLFFSPPSQVRVDSASGFAFDPASAFKKFDLGSIKNPGTFGEIREESEIVYGDQVSFSEKMATVKEKQYKTFADEGLSSAKEWEAAPSPKRGDPKKALIRLQTGFDLVAGDGRTVTMDQAVLDHWKIEGNKTPEDIKSRLECLQYAIETIEKPNERWDQESQCRYLKKFQKMSGGYEGCMVVVTNDGKCRTYFLPSVSKLDSSRFGIGCKVNKKVESSTGHHTTQTVETIAVPDRFDGPNGNNTPYLKKVKEEQLKKTQKIKINNITAFTKTLKSSNVTAQQKKYLMEEFTGDTEPPKRVVLGNPLVDNVGYNPKTDTLTLYSKTDASTICHELTHVWQIKMQAKSPGIINEIQAAHYASAEKYKVVLIVPNSKNAVYFGPHSKHPEDEEALLPRKYFLRGLKIRKDGDTVYVLAEEVPR